MSLDSHIFAMSAAIVRSNTILKKIVNRKELKEDDIQEAKSIIKLIKEIID
tara:strand:+ start:2793 stop:2945 length:153 start_codon:yes stop_codon:yes gene_type:complete